METETKQIRTPFVRLVAALFIGELGFGLAIVTSMMLLLTFKLTEIDPNNVVVDLSLVTGIAVLFALIGNPIGGAISDRTQLKFGRRRTWILLGSILGCTCLMGIAFATDVLMVLVFWCAAQGMLNFSIAAITALIADQVDESKRGRASGIVSISQAIGGLMGFALMNALTNTPIVVRFAATVVISILLAIICCILVKEGKFAYRKPQTVKKFGGLASFFPSPRKYPNFTWAWITRFFIMAANSYYIYYAIILGQRFGYTEAQITQKMLILMVVYTLFTVLSSLLGGFLSDKFRKQKLFVWSSAFVVAVGLIFLALANNFDIFIVGAGISGFGIGIYLAVDLALNTRILPNKENTAKDLGIINVASTLPQSIVPVFAPIVLAGWGFIGFFLLFAAFAVLSGLTVMPIPEMPPKPLAPDEGAPEL